MGDEMEVLALGSQSTRTTPALLMKMAWWLPLRSRRPKRTLGHVPDLEAEMAVSLLLVAYICLSLTLYIF